MNDSRLRAGGAWLGHIALVVLLFVGLFTAPRVSASSQSTSARQPVAQSGGIISAALQQTLASASTDQWVRVIVRFKRQADLRAARASVPALPERGPELRRAIVNALRAASDNAQQDFSAFLAQNRLVNQVNELRPFWIFNSVALQGTPQAIRTIATDPSVASIELDAWRKRIEPTPALPFDSPRASASILAPLTVTPPALPPWGIQKIRANQVWIALGITGTGVTIGNIDTGVDWQHPLLQPSYRGWRPIGLADHLHNWFDATDEAAAYPTDMNGHGTHTMGTIAGQGGIGVAPGARWIAAKGLNGDGYGLDSWLHAAFQFMLAPGGEPSYAPDVVSNSWGNDDGTDTTFGDDVAALQAAGILVVFSNGNRGPHAGSVGSPASLPDSVGIGATDSDDDVAYFSSRGPSPFGEVRPHLSAPGVNVVSTYPGGRYATASGTSMAAPHVAGTAALLLSAKPSLSIISTLAILTGTAVPLSTTLPNNDSGWGRLDAYNAVLAVINTGVISGSVRDGAQPISDSLVTVFSDSRQMSALTNSSGTFTILAPPGIYTATASAYGYYPITIATPLLVFANQVSPLNINLSYLPSGAVRGTVQDVVTGAALTQTLITALGTPRTAHADQGSYPPYRYFIDLPAGTYTIEARLLGYLAQTRTVTVVDDQITDANFTLTPTQRIALVDSGPWYYGSQIQYYRAALAELGLAYDEFSIKHVPTDAPTLQQLSAYDTVIWSAPFDSPGISGGSAVLTPFLKLGRNLMISGQDVGYYDGGGISAPLAYYDLLHANFVEDGVASRLVVGAPGSLLAGRLLTITGGDGANNQEIVDAAQLKNADFAHLLARFADAPVYRDGAGVYSQQCLDYRAAYFTFGVEAINTAPDRASVLKSVLDAFSTPRPIIGIEMLSLDDFATGSPIGLPGEVITHQLRLRHMGDAGSTDAFTLTLSGNHWNTTVSRSHAQLAPCDSASLMLTVTVPLTATWNERDVITLTATSAVSPVVSASTTFTTKTPTPVLLVDDDRFTNHEASYLADLAANHNSADRWDTAWVTGFDRSPTLALMSKYPIVIWYTAYDWHNPLTSVDEDNLRRYLDQGGRLFLTSQSALYNSGLSPLMKIYLGVAAIDYSDVTTQVTGAPNHVIGAGFTFGSMLPFPYNWNLSSAVQPMRNAQVILRGESGQPFGLANECALPCAGLLAWRSVFMPFAFETLNSTARANLMNRVTGWLSWLGDSTLTPERNPIAPGDTLTWTVLLRADDVISHAIHLPDVSGYRVKISVPVHADVTVISSTLASATAHMAGAWQGDVQAGQVLSWTFVTSATQGLSAGTALTAALQVGLENDALNFTREAVVYINAPVMTSTLDVQPVTAFWNHALTVTLRVTNTSAFDAPGARVVNALPTGLKLLTPTIALVGSGYITMSGNRIDWAGGLSAGAAITITYAISVPQHNASLPREFYHTAQAYNGVGTVIQSAVWLVPIKPVAYLPLVLR